MSRTETSSALSRLCGDRRGNFGMLAAITLPLAIMAGGIVIDMSNSVHLRTRMQAAADSAALATTTGLVTGLIETQDAKDYAISFFSGQLTEDFPDFDAMKTKEVVEVEELKVDGRPLFRVSFNVEAKRSVSAASLLFGEKKLTIAIRGQSEAALESIGAISMSFVLDRSGSMYSYSGGQRKINALKKATGALLDQLDDADPERKYVRVGGASYNDEMQGNTPMTWGTDNLRAFVNALPAEGGTESSVAFNWAYQAVMDPDEDTLHYAANEQVPAKVMVFLTDGDNNQRWSDDATKEYCDAAKKDKVQIYTVAFAAPSKGRKLLQYCATSESYYFDAADSDELISAFRVIGMRAAKLISRLTE